MTQNPPSLCCHQPLGASVPRLSLHWDHGGVITWVAISFSSSGPAHKWEVQPSQAKLSWQKNSEQDFSTNKLQHFQSISLGGFSYAVRSTACWRSGVDLGAEQVSSKKSKRQVKNYHGCANMRSFFQLHQDTHSKTPGVVIALCLK